MWISKSDFDDLLTKIERIGDDANMAISETGKLSKRLFEIEFGGPKVTLYEPINLLQIKYGIVREQAEVPVLDILEMLAKEIGCKIEYVPGKKPGAQIVKQQKPKGAKK